MEKYIQYTILKKKDMDVFGDLVDEGMTGLAINSDIVIDLSVLANYPNLKRLSLCGKFSGFENVTMLKSLETLEISLNSFVYEDLEVMMTDRLKYLVVSDMRKLEDLTFIKKSANLEKLYLNNLPAVKRLPDFNKIYALKIYELHKVENIDSLAASEIRYLGLTLFADKLSATEIATTLMEMKKLEKADTYFIDRNCRRTGTIENRLIKGGKENIIAENGMFNYDNWMKL